MGIIINGKSYKGNNITINNNQVIVDGNIIGDDVANEQLIFITGNIENIHVESSDVDVDGNVGLIKTMSGDVNVLGNVHNNLSTQSGDVVVKGNVGGNIKTMSGDIKYRK